MKRNVKPAGMILESHNGGDTPEVDEAGDALNKLHCKFAQDGFKMDNEGITESPDTGCSAGSSGADKGTPVSEFKYSDMKLGKLLGRGACSEVFLATHKPTQRLFAVKRFDVADKQKRQQLITELRGSLGNSCGHVVSIVDAFYTHEDAVDYVMVLLEYMSAGALDDIIARQPRPNEKVVAAVVAQLALGLQHLHRVVRKCHRDFKPGNVLVDAEGHVKISDLGLSKEMMEFTIGATGGGGGGGGAMSTFVGTVAYLAPERMKGDSYSANVDVWALGMTAFELAHKAHPYPFKTLSYIELLQTIVEGPVPEPHKGASPEFRDFLAKCLEKDPRKRAHIDEIVSHPFVKNADGVDVVAEWLALERESYSVPPGATNSSAAATKTTSTSASRPSFF